LCVLALAPFSVTLLKQRSLVAFAGHGGLPVLSTGLRPGLFRWVVGEDFRQIVTA
jgi:hypothetical protein